MFNYLLPLDKSLDMYEFNSFTGVLIMILLKTSNVLAVLFILANAPGEGSLDCLERGFLMTYF
jgi:hypothetical protein